MTEINNIQSFKKPNFNPVGKTDDGKIIVDVKDMASDGYTRQLVPEENLDKFEKTVNDFQDKYEPFVKNHYAKGNKVLHTVSLMSATLGGAIAAACMKPNTKATGRFLKTAGGALTGWITAAAALSAVLLKDFFGYGKKIKELGVVTVPMLKNQQPNIAPQQQKPAEPVEASETKEKEEKR